jgi:DNA adenine methylase
MKTSIPRPFIKWVGGKSQIMDTLLDLAPDSFEEYFEPFAGGASIFWALLRQGCINAATISDLNKQLVIATATVMERLDSVIVLLKSPIFANNEKNYYAVRAWDREEDWRGWKEWISKRENWPMVTARFIFLNKLAFNGLWRENLKGQHNAPYCKDETAKVLDEKNLRSVSNALRKLGPGLKLGRAGFDFLALENFDLNAQHGVGICPTDFCYMDPPYVTTFTDYTSEGFNMRDFERLKDIIDELTETGVYVMLSMKDTPRVRKMFSKYRIVSLRTNCRINRDASKRKNGMSELVIMNYDEDSKILEVKVND